MAGGRLWWALCVVSVGLFSVCSGKQQPPDNRVEALEITRVTRDVDLTSPLAKEKVTMVVENKGKKSVAYVLYAVDPKLVKNMAFINAEVSLESMGH